MKIQLNTDKNIEGTQNLEMFVNRRLEETLKHFSNHITRVEVHLSDQNADKPGPDDVQCTMEARLQKLKPVTVTSKSDSREKALEEAIKKMKASLTTVMGKIRSN